MNFALLLPNDVRVILVTRIFPDDDRELGPNYNCWREIQSIFKENIPHLQTIQIAPVFSENDPICMGMLSYAANHRIPDNDPRFFNMISPVELSHVSQTLCEAATHWHDGKTTIVSGNAAVSYAALLNCIKSALDANFFKHTLNRIVNGERALPIEDEAIFLEDLQFHSAGEQPMCAFANESEAQKIFQRCTDFVREQSDVSVLGSFCAILGNAKRNDNLQTIFETTTKSRNHVYRIAHTPTRSVAEIADLFMQWLPRYFQRTMKLETTGNARKMLRLHRIPVAEFERIDETWKRSRILIRWPLGLHIDATASLLVTVTGTPESPRELLIVCEDGPNASWFTNLGRAIMASFGKYLRDYGVAQ